MKLSLERVPLRVMLRVPSSGLSFVGTVSSLQGFKTPPAQAGKTSGVVLPLLACDIRYFQQTSCHITDYDHVDGQSH